MPKLRPFLKWAGSKYNCLQEVLSALPNGNRLIEPFAGTCVVFMNTQFSSYLLAENNQDLVQLYLALQQQGEEFIAYCNSFFKPENNNKEIYYQIRSHFNTLSYDIERAATFLYLNRHGYNGLCRYNSSGGYNVPFGLYVKPYFPFKEMMSFFEKSREAQFIHNDFRSTFAQAQRGDIIYCDPPYVPFSEHSKPFSYTRNQFLTHDQIELAELAQETAAKGIPVIISNHDTEFTRTHYKKAKIKSFPVSRWINCHVNERKPVSELIAVFK